VPPLPGEDSPQGQPIPLPGGLAASRLGHTTPNFLASEEVYQPGERALEALLHQ
jgi:hypothetical protein